MVFIDFSKAFDLVCHDILLAKLYKYGVHGDFLNWCRHYLTERQQRLIVKGEASDWLTVTSGIPQGSLLGPLFFIIIHQTHYEKSDWSRAFNQFTIACELDMINAISAADVAFIMSSSTSAPWSVLLRNKMAERFASVSEDELCEKCIIKQLLNSVFAWYHD